MVLKYPCMKESQETTLRQNLGRSSRVLTRFVATVRLLPKWKPPLSLSFHYTRTVDIRVLRLIATTSFRKKDTGAISEHRPDEVGP